MVPYLDVPRYLSAADICVAPEPSAPYNDRSTAVKLMEYMSLAKPIIAFDLTEHRFTAQGAARYVKPNDELKFAQAIVELMDDPAERDRMGLLGRQRMETELAWQYSIPKLLEVYRNVLPIPAASPFVSQRQAEPEIHSMRQPERRLQACQYVARDEQRLRKKSFVHHPQTISLNRAQVGPGVIALENYLRRSSQRLIVAQTRRTGAKYRLPLARLDSGAHGHVWLGGSRLRDTR